MSTLVCLLEEKSAEEMLKALLPKILPAGMAFTCITFEGKQDLEKRLHLKVRHWQKPDSYFLVMRDQDSGDCITIKRKLLEILAETGKEERALVRIACHELESFYLGDLAAVEKGLGSRGLSGYQHKRKFTDPDMLANAAEELKKLTGKSYQKISGSRKISPYMVLDGSNKSKSFNTLLHGIKTLLKLPT